MPLIFITRFIKASYGDILFAEQKCITAVMAYYADSEVHMP